MRMLITALFIFFVMSACGGPSDDAPVDAGSDECCCGPFAEPCDCSFCPDTEECVCPDAQPSPRSR